MALTQPFVRGCLVGLAVGDALGGPLQGMDRFEIAQRFGGGVRSMLGGGRLKLRPGETTAATAMARLLARSLVEREHFDANDVAARYAAWLRTNPKGVEPTIRLALQAWRAGLTLPHAALGAHRQLGHSAGNGTIMRCAPIALRYAYDERRLIDASRDEALITHFDPRAWSGSVALNLLIVALLREIPLGEALHRVADRLRREPRAAHELGDALETISPQTRADALRTSATVSDTLRVAVWALLTHASFEEAVAAAVNLGGETAIQGAVTGALAGARWGEAAIPPRWLERLQERDELITLADQLLALAERGRVVI